MSGYQTFFLWINGYQSYQFHDYFTLCFILNYSFCKYFDRYAIVYLAHISNVCMCVCSKYVCVCVCLCVYHFLKYVILCLMNKTKLYIYYKGLNILALESIKQNIIAK